MLFMVIESFRNQDPTPVYRRLEERGRLMPDSVTFRGSWVAADLSRCFQLMECEDIGQLQRWVAAWTDLVAFEIVPVTEGTEVAEALAQRRAASSDA